MDFAALLLTLRLAITTTVVLSAVAVPLAWWISSQRGFVKAIVQTVVALPLVLPPTVIGFYLLVALGPLTPFGRVWIHLVGHPLAFSFAGLLIGSLLYSLPFAVQPLVAGFSAVDPGYAEAASALGVGPWRNFREVVLPMVRGSVLTAMVLTFTHTVGEFGVVLMLGGNIPGATRTLSISLYDQVQDFDYAAANRTAGLLLGVAVMALLVIYMLPHRRRAGRGDFVA
ncbi:molybdate ABC transporter permease subunit [Granulicella arctica]|uniref:molybdate ABC transporter permease subunit n=1 Tax=Granulicella arctica TaxID=940613 RepID=UPI0021E04BC1|nr:molybdate ABC transporter permease subunit [Granulicella arctica]